ncbi:MAG: small, acid-soluble spore protein, alpha/beta type [Bacillota bacterium]|nr:small, acid-soluble spore protein, alpha/beta type [Bacillota bacterium]
MSHADNKNSKDNKKSNDKTKRDLDRMKVETSDEIGYSKESKKLGKDKNRENE